MVHGKEDPPVQHNAWGTFAVDVNASGRDAAKLDGVAVEVHWEGMIFTAAAGAGLS